MSSRYANKLRYEGICCSDSFGQGYRNESNEATQFGPHAVRKRTLKSGRVKGEKQSKANPDRASRLIFIKRICTRVVTPTDAVAISLPRQTGAVSLLSMSSGDLETAGTSIN